MNTDTEPQAANVTNYDGPVEISGHLFLFMPATGDLDEKSSNRWISCMTCDRKLAQDADPKTVVEQHVAGEREGVDPYAPRLFGVPK